MGGVGQEEREAEALRVRGSGGQRTAEYADTYT